MKCEMERRKRSTKKTVTTKKNKKNGGKRCAGGFQTVDGLVLEQRSPTHIRSFRPRSAHHVSRLTLHIVCMDMYYVYSTVVCRDRLSAISSRVRDDCAD